MLGLSGVRTATAGAIVKHGDRFVFQVGIGGSPDDLGVVRLGGHVEGTETLEECALREIEEEAGTTAGLVPAPATFQYDPIGEDLKMTDVAWPDGGITPLFVVRAPATRALHDLSVTYLAEALGTPIPSNETQALMFLSRPEVVEIATSQVRLDSLLLCGGVVIESVALPRHLPLRPHGQVRALAHLIQRGVL